MRIAALAPWVVLIGLAGAISLVLHNARTKSEDAPAT